MSAKTQRGCRWIGRVENGEPRVVMTQGRNRLDEYWFVIYVDGVERWSTQDRDEAFELFELEVTT